MLGRPAQGGIHVGVDDARAGTAIAVRRPVDHRSRGADRIGALMKVILLVGLRQFQAVIMRRAGVADLRLMVRVVPCARRPRECNEHEKSCQESSEND